MTEEDFEMHVLANLDKAEKSIGYHFKGIRDLIKEHGAVETAKLLVDVNMVLNIHSGFKVLDPLVRSVLSRLSDRMPELEISKIVAPYIDTDINLSRALKEPCLVSF